MSDTSTHLGLPYLLAAQAQKHVTHNEALRLLDAMVQLSVLDRTRTTPPAGPADGDRHLVASGATGLWAGWDLNVAFWIDGVWLRLVPRQGWLVWIAAEQVFVVWNGSAWDPVGVPQDVSDAIFSLVNDADPTKKALFSLSGISTGTTRTFTPAGRGLVPFAPVHIGQPWRMARSPGDLTIRWTRRSRALVADAWEQVEVPLAEDLESYDVQILDGAVVKRTLASGTTSVVYNAAQQTADWGAPLGPGQTLSIRIFQLSNRLGRGTPAAVTLQF